MRESIRKANEALLEGDRDAVLRHLEGESSSDPEVIWLRAHGAASDEERLRLLRSLSSGKDSTYRQLAGEILEREERFEREMSEPPDYQFWKQPTWKARQEKMKQYRIWVIGGIILAVMIIFAIILTITQKNQTEQEAISFQATQTVVAFSSQTIANYPAGSLQIVQAEYPTTRAVTFGEMEDNQYIPASPAPGSRFAAVRIRFTCSMALCATPPEATIILQLTNGLTVNYNSSSQPFLVEQPSLSRVAAGQSIEGWLVFEVPTSATPDALLVYYSEQEPPQLVDWPVK